MRHRFITLLALLAGMALVACGGGANTPATAPQSTNAPAAQVTTAPQATVPAQPAATPDIEKILKAQPEDWKRGPADAKVTIIEWGDFQ